MLPGVNPKMLQRAMKQMGVKERDIPAIEVLIKTPSGDLVIRHPEVKEVEMMGQKSLQIQGILEEVSSFSVEDIATVVAQTGVSSEHARAALEAAKGDLAQAILSIQNS